MTDRYGSGGDRGPPREANERSPGREPGDERPPPRRNYALAIVMALIVFALLIGIRWFGTLTSGPPTPTIAPADGPAATDTEN